MPLDLSAPRRVPGPRCTVGRARTRLDTDDLARLDAALDDDTFTNQMIGAAIAGADEVAFTVGTSAIARHRRGDCACGRTR